MMEFAEKGHRQKECPDLPVGLLLVLHTLRLECKKLMKLTASHCSCLLWFTHESRVKAALLESAPIGAQKKCR